MDDSLLGVIFTIVALCLLALTGAVFHVAAVNNIESDCEHFGKFVVNDRAYECAPTDTGDSND